MKAHISVETLLSLIEEAECSGRDGGICTACGIDVDGVEPDARNYRCPDCGEMAVSGTLSLMEDM